MSNYLKGKRCYLSGPIEYDCLPNWRDEPTRVLRERFGIDVFDPSADEKQQLAPMLREARKQRDFETMAKICKIFVRKDLCHVDRCDFLVSCLPKDVPTAGSHHEIIVSDNAKKPTLIVCPDGKEFVPLWFYGFIPHRCMFGEWEGLYKHLKEVDEGLHKDDWRWAFIYGML